MELQKVENQISEIQLIWDFQMIPGVTSLHLGIPVQGKWITYVDSQLGLGPALKEK